jgi:hypothetical protein
VGGLLVCLILLWFVIGFSLLSKLNRGEHEVQRDGDRVRRREPGQGELAMLWRDEGLGSVLLLLLIVVVGWPWMLYMIKQEQKDKDGR